MNQIYPENKIIENKNPENPKNPDKNPVNFDKNPKMKINTKIQKRN